MKLSELFCLSNLSEFRIGEGYFLELEHGLAGYFPALISKTMKPFVCLDEATIRKALLILTRRAFKINKAFFLINDRKKLVFSLHALDYQKERLSLPLLAEYDVKNMKVGDLKWAPGLIGPGMTKGEFKETLRVALDEIKSKKRR